MQEDMMAVPLRVVFDCNVFLQAVASDLSPANAALLAAEGGAFELLLSNKVLAEYAEVMSRPRVRTKLPSLTSKRIAVYLLKLSRSALTIDPVPDILKLPRDPTDDKYLNLVLAGKAEILITRDRDFEEIQNDRTLREAIGLAQTLTPEEFLLAFVRK